MIATVGEMNEGGEEGLEYALRGTSAIRVGTCLQLRWASYPAGAICKCLG